MGLGARLALVFAAVVAATALLVGGASYLTTDRQVSADVDDFLRERSREISEGRRGRPQARDRGDRGRGSQGVPVGPDSEVQVVGPRGNVLVSNSDLILPVDSIDTKLAEQAGNPVLRTVSVEGADYRMITRHLQPGAALQVARSLEEPSSLLRVLRTRLGVVTAVLALLAAGVGWVLAQRTTRPLRALSAAVDNVAATQNFTDRVPTTGSDEVGRLGHGFNRMLGALQQSKEQQRRLVQDAAHELRTPLTSVTANLDWLERAPNIDPETRAATLGSVRRELGELNNVITEIIELATDTYQDRPLESVDLLDTVESAVALFVERTGREVSIDGHSVSVTADAEALGRAIGNLLSNAEKYSPAEAPIGVVVGADGVFVDDAGSGIPKAEHQAIFDRFYRRDDDRAKPGSGLGLSIVADIVEHHGGSLHVSRSPLGGARVGFVLPAR